jgi:hypothetical protein
VLCAVTPNPSIERTSTGLARFTSLVMFRCAGQAGGGPLMSNVRRRMNTELSTNALLNKMRLLALKNSWSLVAKDFQLSAPGAASRAKSLGGDAGTYLWTLVSGDEQYTLYIGKCSNLAKRIYGYTQSFQPHAPNDRKLVFAQIALTDLVGNAAFDLHFKHCALEDIDRMETEAIKLFSPILNQRTPYSQEARLEFEAMYQAFYRGALAAAFGDA